MTIIPDSWRRRLAKWLVPTAARTSFNQQQARRANHDLSVDDVIAAIDGAESGDFSGMVALGMQMVCSDGHVRTEFAKRKLAVMGDHFDVVAYDKALPDDVAAAKAIKAWIEECDDWDDAVKALLEACFWPVAVVEKTFRDSPGDGRRFTISGLRRVDPELFDYSLGRLRIKDTDEAGNVTGGFHDPDPAQYVVHRGDPICLPDQKGGLIRPLLFWYFLKAKDWEWWGQFLERFGAPFMVGRYDDEDEASQLKLEDAFGRAARLFGVTVSKDTEIELVQAQTSQGGDAFEKLHRTANEEISKVILGQFGTSQGTSGGLNSNTASVLDGVRQDFKFYDALQLGDCMRRQIFRQYLMANGIYGRAPRAVWGDTGSQDNETFARRLVAYRQAGLRLSEASIRQVSDRESVAFEWEHEAQQTLSAGRVARLSLDKTAEIANARMISAALPRLARGPSAGSRFALLDVADDDPFLEAMLASAIQGG